jgi:Rieske Fe-S protein
LRLGVRIARAGGDREFSARAADGRHEQSPDGATTAGPGQTRREFCADACQLLSIAALGVAAASVLESCGGGSGGPTSASGAPSLPVVSGVSSGASVAVSIDASSPLSAVGTAALLQTSRGTVLVAHTGADSYAAFGATCTHQTCTITGYSGQTFVCPCHGSQFDTSGRAVRGPAVASLTRHNTQFANGVLTVTL